MENHVGNSTQRYNLSDFELDFKHYLTAVKKLKAVSVKNYLSDFRFFYSWVNAHAQSLRISEEHPSNADFFAQFTPDLIASYKSYLENEGLPQKTVNRRLSATRAFFAFTINQGWIEANPARTVKNVKKSDHSLSQSPEIVVDFAQDLTTQGLSTEHAQQAANDIEEFFKIINSAQ